ncbi:carbamoyl transferase [Deltaproteobacteria bacterium]|nr:carbamoyl transferase [Deltaproteobacteria bacterium]
MKILGICNDETASACLMIDGEIVCAASEERFTRVKLDNSFPLNSIQFCLDHCQLTLPDVDVIAYAWYKGFDPYLLQQYTASGAEYSGDDNSFKIMQERIKWEISQDRKKRDEFDHWVAKNIHDNNQKVMDFYHHEAHAASASFVSPFDKGYVFTCDARGDFESATIYKFCRKSDQKLQKIFSATSIESFGFYYGRITGLLGFKPMRHEGKVTGLAAYGDKKKALPLCKKMLEVSVGKIKAHLGDFYCPFFAPYSEKLNSDIAKFSKEDIAASAQEHLEQMMTDLLIFYINKEGVSDVNLMCAGGVFGNVKVTQRLKELPSISRVYVQPQMGDGGLCIGACALANEIQSDKSDDDVRSTIELKSMYLGPLAKYRDRSRDDYRNEFVSNKYDFETSISEFTNSLANDKVIGLINGRMEFGPRALCNRSIIYKTSDKTINDWLNKRLNRTEFMPFAPVLRAEIASDCFQNYEADDVTLNFMTSTVDCISDFANRCPAVVHVDQTARPQIVTQDSNRFIWCVLKRWEQISSEMSLINTSFNVHEEPIVCDVDEGLSSLRNGVIDELYVLENDSATCFVVKS